MFTIIFPSAGMEAWNEHPSSTCKHMGGVLLGYLRLTKHSIVRWLEPVILRSLPSHRMMAGQRAGKAHAEAGLRTEKLREQDLRRRAAALGPVPIHVHFQNGLVLQVTIITNSRIIFTRSGVFIRHIMLQGCYRLYIKSARLPEHDKNIQRIHTKRLSACRQSSRPQRSCQR